MIYTLKIRPKFIENIKKGYKQREYRLNNSSRQKIKIGDYLKMVSNNDKSHFVMAMVIGISTYSSWEEVFDNNWNDFIDVYKNKEEALSECSRFYSAEDIEKFGLISFNLLPIENNIRSSNVVLFNLSSAIKPDYKLQSFLNELKKRNISFSIADKNFKYTNYVNLYDNDFSNDSAVDKIIENLLNNNRCLVTNNENILAYAKSNFYDEIIMSYNEFLAKRNSCEEIIDYNSFNIILRNFNDINLSDPFFDKLRLLYPEFDKWFNKKCSSNDNAYVYMQNNKIDGFLFMKIEAEDENYDDIIPSLKPKKRLKIGTFKVNSTGKRLGERFLMLIFNNALKENVEEIYVTIYKNKDPEIDTLYTMLSEWGFVLHGKKNDEDVLVKDMKNFNIEQKPQFNFPLYNSNANIYTLSIYPNFHDILFPDNVYSKKVYNSYNEEAFQFAIKKVFLSGAKFLNCKKGDLLVIYRTSDHYMRQPGLFTGLCIINNIFKPNSFEECAKLVKNRSLFPHKSLAEFYRNHNFVIELLYLCSFANPMDYKSLINQNIITKDNIKSFAKIEKDAYNKLEVMCGGKKYG